MMTISHLANSSLPDLHPRVADTNNMDEKEYEDRMVAAEVMSNLSSVVVLSGAGKLPTTPPSAGEPDPTPVGTRLRGRNSAARLVLKNPPRTGPAPSRPLPPSDVPPARNEKISLPLKKRKIINFAANSEGRAPPSAHLDSARGRPEERAAATCSGGGTAVASTSQYKPVQVDPQASLIMLTELKTALLQDEDGDLPLHIAVVQENLPMVMKYSQLLLWAGKTVDRYNKAKQTPLHLAVKLNFLQAVKGLLQMSANINLVDGDGLTALHLAVKLQLSDCFHLMLKESKVEPDLNCRDFEGMTPLHSAVLKKEKMMIKTLLDRGSEIDAMDGKSGRTPLFHAAENNQEEIVELLLKRKAALDVPNYAGSTAFMAVNARGFHSITKMLVNYGADTKGVTLGEDFVSSAAAVQSTPARSLGIVKTKSGTNPS